LFERPEDHFAGRQVRVTAQCVYNEWNIIQPPFIFKPKEWRTIVPSDKPVSSDQDVFTKPANGKTAGSYLTDGRWNLGGWSTYPSADELAISNPARRADAQPSTRKK
jgi:hypothetical protein